MSQDPAFLFGQPGAPVAAAPLAPAVPYRHPLGLPRGSVRALLTFMVLGTIWALLLMPPEKGVAIPLYLFYLMFLVIGSYFGHRGSHSAAPGAPREHPPLYLPRGSIRFLIIVGFFAVCGWGWYKDHEFFEKIKFDDIKKEPYLPLIIFGTFALGVVINAVASMVLKTPEGMPAWYSDVLAWVSLLAVLGLGFLVIYLLVIAPSVEHQNDLARWPVILSAIVAFYFGTRS